MSKTKKIPLRMCIACREMKEKRQMLRIVKNTEGEISLDKTGKKPGRGAYICDNPECIARLNKNKLLNRTFSANVSSEVYKRVEDEYFGKEK